MSHLDTLKRALLQYRPDSYLTVDDVRYELVDCSQIPGPQLGPIFGEAVQKGYLADTGLTARTRHKPGKRRRICVYQVTEKVFVEHRQQRRKAGVTG